MKSKVTSALPASSGSRAHVIQLSAKSHTKAVNRLASSEFPTVQNHARLACAFFPFFFFFFFPSSSVEVLQIYVNTFTEAPLRWLAEGYSSHKLSVAWISFRSRLRRARFLTELAPSFFPTSHYGCALPCRWAVTVEEMLHTFNIML